MILPTFPSYEPMVLKWLIWHEPKVETFNPQGLVGTSRNEVPVGFIHELSRPLPTGTGLFITYGCPPCSNLTLCRSVSEHSEGTPFMFLLHNLGMLQRLDGLTWTSTPVCRFGTPALSVFAPANALTTWETSVASVCNQRRVSQVTLKNAWPNPTCGGHLQLSPVQPSQAFLTTDFWSQWSGVILLGWTTTSKVCRDRSKATCRDSKRWLWSLTTHLPAQIWEPYKTYKNYPTSCSSCLASRAFSSWKRTCHWIKRCLTTRSTCFDDMQPTGWALKLMIWPSCTHQYPQNNTSFYNSLSKTTGPAVHRTWGLWHRRSLSRQRWSHCLPSFHRRSTCHLMPCCESTFSIVSKYFHLPSLDVWSLFPLLRWKNMRCKSIMGHFRILSPTHWNKQYEHVHELKAPISCELNNSKAFWIILGTQNLLNDPLPQVRHSSRAADSKASGMGETRRLRTEHCIGGCNARSTRYYTI